MSVSNKIADGLESVKDFVQEHTGLRRGDPPHLPVFASDGAMIGVVDKVEGEQIKLTRKDSPDGQHHTIPTAWVQDVDDTAVRLSKTSAECHTGMRSGGSCGC